MNTDFSSYQGSAPQSLDDATRNNDPINNNGLIKIPQRDQPQQPLLNLNESQVPGSKDSFAVDGNTNIPITNPARVGLLQWGRNLSLGKKQLAGLLASEMIALLGLIGISSFLIVSSGRQQLIKQARSDLSVISLLDNPETAPFPGQQQTVHPNLQEVAAEIASGQSPSSNTVEDVRQLLQTKQVADNLAYVTLVDLNQRIIANANADRSGERFDPEGLVGTVLQNPRVIVTYSITPGEEIQAEQLPLSQEDELSEALVKYTLIPVTAPNAETVVGVLILGNLINGGEAVSPDLLTALGEGYEAIYQQRTDGSQTLAATTGEFSDIRQLSTARTTATESNETTANIPYTDLLSQAVAEPSQITTKRAKIGDTSYTLAAKALTNFNQEPIGVLVRGIPETSLNQALSQKLRLQLLVAVLVVVANLGIAYALKNVILTPLKSLQRATWRFGLGEREARAVIYGADEVGQVAHVFNQLAEKVVASEGLLYTQQQEQGRSLRWEQYLSEAVIRMRETLNESQIFQVTVDETRRILQADRSVIYAFDDDWKGTFIAESVVDGWSKAINNDLYDPCFAERYVKQYQKGRVQITCDIYNAGLTDCHINQLETYEVKANLVAPIIVNTKLMGLLIVHQCRETRDWTDLEVEFIRKISIQLGFAIEQARLLADTEARQQRLQMQLVELLSDVEGASSGDLTVRANVTAGEIGTVADFFNAIVESLRQIVTKVKESATQVNDSLGENETSIRTLANEALRQADEVTNILASVQTMTASIQQVANSAQQAADVASTASLTAENSGQAMDLTVQNILNLRDIIGETSKKVKRLGESSQQISKVVSLINQIAMQTNLLAINAGIEAARAGEEGQGFAVVAEEVGELAARSADATQEIERIVETIQRETVEVVEAMEQSTTEVVAGTHLVEDAKQSFGRILDVSRQIDQLVQSISSATVSQVEISETVTQLMQDIAQVSGRTSDASLEITSSLRRTVEVAQALQASVGEFKTGQA